MGVVLSTVGLLDRTRLGAVSSFKPESNIIGDICILFLHENKITKIALSMIIHHGLIKPLGMTERPTKGMILKGRSRDLHK